MKLIEDGVENFYLEDDTAIEIENFYCKEGIKKHEIIVYDYLVIDPTFSLPKLKCKHCELKVDRFGYVRDGEVVRRKKKLYREAITTEEEYKKLIEEINNGDVSYSFSVSPSEEAEED